MTSGQIVTIVDHVGLKAGMECYDLELYYAMKEAGWNPYVFSNFQSPLKNESVYAIFAFRIKETIFSFFKIVKTYDTIAARLKKLNCSHCIIHGFRFGYWEWVMIRKLVKSGAKLHLIVHDPGSLIGFHGNEKWRNKIFSFCNSLIVHNRYSYDQLSGHLNEVEIKKTVVIPHGNFIRSAVQATELKSFRKDHLLDPQKKQLLFFGQIKETKGLDVLLKALAQTDPEIELTIAGRMRKHSFDIYSELIKKYKLEKRVRLFIEYISPEMRNMLFQVSDAVVLPYKKVYQSGVLLMAMGYGKSVIASDLLPNRELITDGSNGFLFQEGNIQDLAAKIQAVMHDDKAREDVGMAGQQFVKDKLNWAGIAGKWIALFQS